MTTRPGSNAAQPHSDLRLPRLHSHDVPRGTEASDTFGSAQLLASLHRAAEVARFEWRAQAARAQAAAATATASSRSSIARDRYSPLPTSAPSPLDAGSMLRAAQAADAAALRRTYEAGRGFGLSRRSGAGMLDVSDVSDDESSTSASSSDIEESDEETDRAVLQATLSATMSVRHDEARQRAAAAAAAGTSSATTTAASASGFQSYAALAAQATNVGGSSESALDVWNRMIVDLANPESYPIVPPISRFLPTNAGGWDFPTLAESSNNRGARSLPHPVWARRYPGPAGVWLRAELARRQGEARHRLNSDEARTPGFATAAAASSASPFPRLGPIVMPPHMRLTARTADADSPPLVRDAAMSSDARRAAATLNASSSSSSSASARTAAARVAQLANTARERRRAQRNAALASSREAAVEAVIAATDAAVASSSPSRAASAAEQRSRATRGGLAYLEHLRELDVRNEARREEAALAQRQAEQQSTAAPAGHLSEVFPWYSPSSEPLPISTPESSSPEPRPLEAWYAPRSRHQRTLHTRDEGAAERARIRYGLPKPEDEEDVPLSLGVSDQPRARPWRRGAEVRMRHRAAQVVADMDDEMGEAGTGERTAADGWTLIDPAARQPDSTPAASLDAPAAQPSWLLNASAPSRGFSSSPSPLTATSDEPEPVSATSATRSGSGSSPRSLGRPRRLPSVTPEDIELLRTQSQSTASASASASPSPSATMLVPRSNTARPIPVHASAERRAEYMGLGTIRRSASPSPVTPSEERVPAPTTEGQATTLASQLLRSADSWSSSAAARNYDSLLRRSSSPGAAEATPASPSTSSVAAPAPDVPSTSNAGPSSEYMRSIEEDYQALSQQLPALSSTAVRRAQDRLREFIDLYDEQQRSRISTLRREMEEQRVRLRRLVEASESRENEVQETPSASASASTNGAGAGSSLVRRRTIRDSAPALRPYHRLESRRAAAVSSEPAATATTATATAAATSASTEDLNEAMLSLATLDAAVGAQETWEDETISGGTSPTLGSSNEGEGDKSVEEEAEQQATAAASSAVETSAPAVAASSTPNSLITPEDALALGTLRAAMMRAVDQVGLASYRSAIDRALHARTRHWTPDQPTLPLNEELTNYPLRFEISPLNFTVADAAAASSAVTPGADDVARLVGVLRNDESSFLASRSSNVDIGLRFLACLPHSGQTSRPLWRTEQQPQQPNEATHAPRTTLVAPASSDAQRQATLARLTSVEHRDQVSSEDRAWARARRSVIGGGGNVDDSRRALGLPPRSANVAASAAAPTRASAAPATTIAGPSSEARSGWAARIAALDRPLSEHQMDLLARLGFARWNNEEGASEGLDGRRSRLNRIAPLASLSSEDIGEIRRLIASLFPEVHTAFPPPPDPSSSRSAREEDVEGAAASTSTSANPAATPAALAPLPLTNYQRQLLSTSITQARASPRAFAEASASSQPAIQQLIQSRSASFAEAAVAHADPSTREQRRQVVPSFTLCRLTIKVPSRAGANAAMEGLVFVSLRPITASQLQHYDDWTLEDVQHLALREGFPLVQNGAPVVPPRSQPRAAALDDDEWDADPELGDPFSGARVTCTSEGSNNISSSGTSTRHTPPADALRPAAFFRIPAGSAQATLDFMRSRISPNALPDSEVFTVGATHRRRLQGISGSFMAVKLLRSVVEAPAGRPIQPGCEIQWIGAFGWAGVRSSGTAQWRDLTA